MSLTQKQIRRGNFVTASLIDISVDMRHNKNCELDQHPHLLVIAMKYLDMDYLIVTSKSGLMCLVGMCGQFVGIYNAITF